MKRETTAAYQIEILSVMSINTGINKPRIHQETAGTRRIILKIHKN
jgi:hypothetical protein